MRLFLAIELDPSIKDSLRGAIEELRAARAPVRWVRPENLHLTLKFLGETEEEKAAELCSLLAGVCRGIWPFEFDVLGAGVFPATSRPRVVWADIQEPSGTFGKLYGLIETVTEPLGWKPERRGFSPHITLGRVKGNINLDRLKATIGDLKDRHWGTQRSDRLALYRSHLGPGGARYEVLRHIPFPG
ncbi:MAG: RNA 2',3'-cyclic phosphodiesterase [bacterium]|nr:MAG: RNA 2',3'-cyclic phosphodiesterase [bacterium]